MYMYIGRQPLKVQGSVTGWKPASDGYLTDVLEIEAVFQSLGPSFDAPVLTSSSG